MKNYPIILLLLTLYACQPKNKNTLRKNHEVSTKPITGNPIITTAAYYNGHILCLQEDKRLLVLDTLFNPVTDLTEIFSPYKIASLTPFNDSILFSTVESTFFLDTGFTIKKYRGQPFHLRPPDYVDSTYYVYSCSAGEWGGSVFFWNKKTNKTYYYPATAVQQVLPFEGNFIVSNYLAHLSGFSDFLSIKDPANLYEIKTETKKLYCNSYSSIDSIKADLINHVTRQGVKYYADSFITRNLLTFIRNNILYSIYSTNSATILAKHINYRLHPVDTLLKRGLDFTNAKTHLSKNMAVTAYEGQWSTSTADNKITHYHNSGIIVVTNDKITFVEFKAPQMTIERISW